MCRLRQERRPLQAWAITQNVPFVWVPWIFSDWHTWTLVENHTDKSVSICDNPPRDLTHALTAAMICATQGANMCLDQWIEQTSTSNYVLTEHSPQFVCKFFTVICEYIEIKHLTTTRYPSQSIGQVRRRNISIFARLIHYIEIL